MKVEKKKGWNDKYREKKSRKRKIENRETKVGIMKIEKSLKNLSTKRKIENKEKRLKLWK